MNYSLFLTIVAAATSFFTLLCKLYFMFYKKSRLPQEDKTEITSPPSPQSSLSSQNPKHDVFTSFHGADVRKNFLSHFLKEIESKGIDPFIDNNIERGAFIGPELKKAIRGSTMAVVLLSKKYASSSWCLDELVEIMECKKELGRVIPIFYEVDPTDVKKQTGDFGKIFHKTCKGKTKETVKKWSDALAQFATLAGYHSINSKSDAKMIEEIVTEVSNKLFSSTRSNDFDDFVGIQHHMEKMKEVLDLREDADEVRMVGIWGPAGIGKTTLARCLFNQHSGSFDLSVFMADVKAMTIAPVSSDDYNMKLDLQQKLLSQITNQKEGFRISHLGAVQERLNNNRVLVVLDNVDQLVQLQAMAKDTRWFGKGSRIIITTQDQNLLKANGINHIYKVGFPTQPLQIFCMYAFGQKSPKDGFEKLAWEVTLLAGKLPLGLRVMGSYFKGKSKQQWKGALPNLKSHLNGEIENILKLSYDALCDEDKCLFLHLTCFFNYGTIEYLEVYLGNKFSDLRQGLDVLCEKSLISFDFGQLHINSLLVQLGREIVRKKYSEQGKYSILKPGKRQFLLDASNISEVLSDYTAGSSSVIGIDLTSSNPESYISERAFEKMYNLQFLKIYGDHDSLLYFPQSLSSLPSKLILLTWIYFPMTCLPSNFSPKFLVQLSLRSSKLEKLWDGIQPLTNLRRMYLEYSEDLKELPDLSTATNLEILRLDNCSSLEKLPSSIGKATNLKKLYLRDCSSLVKLPSSIGNATNLTTLRLDECSSLEELPSSIGNATNLEELILDYCSSLVELPFSIGNLHKLKRLQMRGCSKLKVLPINVNMESLDDLYLENCPLLKTFPEISTNIKLLKLDGTPVEEVPLAIRSWPRLEELHMSYCEFEDLKDCPHALDSITDLHLTNPEVKELGPWVKGFSGLRRLVLNGMQKLVSLPLLPDSLLFLDAENCESLERIDAPFRNPDISLNFLNCFKLNQEARDFIIQASNHNAAILPYDQVPAYFSDRTTGNTLTVKLSERPLHKPLRFKACVVLVVNKDKDVDCGLGTTQTGVSHRIMDKQSGLIVPCKPASHLLRVIHNGTRHLYTVEFEASYVTSDELVFEIKVDSLDVIECGVILLS